MPSAGGRQVAVQEGLEIAVCGRQPGCLLDLEHELAAGRPVRPGGDDEEVRGVGEPGGDPLRAGGVARPIGDQVGHVAASSVRPDRWAPTAAAATTGLR